MVGNVLLVAAGMALGALAVWLATSGKRAVFALAEARIQTAEGAQRPGMA